MNNYAFIDSQNLHMGLSWKMDYRKFRQYLKNKYNVTKALLFIGYIKKNVKLYDQLQIQGFILIYKNVMDIKRPNGKVTHKGNVDAELVLHAMIEYPNYDKSIIVSNDGDFLCLIQYLEEKEKLQKIICPNNKYSRLLRKFASYIITLDTLKNSLEYKKKIAKTSVRTNP